jgi:hypothetical protein
MTILAMSKARAMRPGAAGILALGDNFEVIEISAGTVAAQVVEAVPFRDRPTQLLPKVLVDAGIRPVDLGTPIAVRGKRAGPHETAVGRRHQARLKLSDIEGVVHKEIIPSIGMERNRVEPLTKWGKYIN